MKKELRGKTTLFEKEILPEQELSMDYKIWSWNPELSR